MINPPQVRPEEPTAVTPHGGICGGESQQWLSYPTNLHVRFDERDVERSQGCASEAPPDERGGNRYAQPTATAPHLDSTMKSLRAARAERPLSDQLADLCRSASADGDAQIPDSRGLG